MTLIRIEREARRLSKQHQALQRVLGSRGAPHEAVPANIGEAYDRYVIWDDITGVGLARGLTPIQRHYIDHTSCWRHAPDGARVRGSDIVLKSRRVHMTSLVLGLGALEMVRSPGFRMITVLQRWKRELFFPLWQKMKAMMSRFPSGWVEIDRALSSDLYGIFLRNGSSWELAAAGASEVVADMLIRGGTPHCIHLSEAGVYDHYPHTWSAARNALPRSTGWLIAECSPPRHASHPFSEEYRLSAEGRGSYLSALFYPWVMDPAARYMADSPEYRRVYDPEFVARVPAADLAREAEMGLDAAQIAFRRWNYHQGDVRVQRQNRREMPEDPITCYGTDGETYIDPLALDQLDEMVREPTILEEIARGWTGRVWRTATRPVTLVTTDSATYRGADRSVVMAWDPWTMDLLGEMVGNATAKMHHAGVLWLLERVGARSHQAHWIAPEINYDDRVGLILDHLVPDRSLRLWYRVHTKRDGTRVVAQVPGVLIRQGLRAQLIAHLVEHLEGEPDAPMRRPSSDLPSAELAREARALIEHVDGKIAARPGAHDDMLMTMAIALYVAPKLQLPRLSQTVAAAPPAVRPGRGGARASGVDLRRPR